MTKSVVTESALSVDDLYVSFATDGGTVDAVSQVSYAVAPGEVLAVVGESGSGKSVSSRAAMGLLPETASVRGTVMLGSRDVSRLSDKAWRELRGCDISMVFQEPGSALDPLFTVGSQIVEALRAHPTDGNRLSKRAAREKAVELLARVKLPDPERRVDYYPHELSGGQKQRVVIAIAVALRPRVIIADEPTTALDVTVQAEILDLLRELRDQTGTAIVLITHNMGVVADLADRVVVMNAGRVVEQAPVAQLFAAPREEYTQTLLAAVPKLGAVSAPDSAGTAAADTEVVLAVSDLTVDFPGGVRAVDGVSFSIHRGETLGLVGESGSGKSTIGRCVAALQKPTSGSVEILGSDIAGMRGRQLRALRKQFGFVFQDPSTALNPRMTIEQCVAEPMVVHKTADSAAMARRVTELLDAVRLPSDSAARYPHELSGGQRQRVNLARALALSPSLIVADEPTSALDVSVQASVLDLLEELQREWQFACLFISHDLAVVERLATRVGVLNQGALVELGTRRDVLINPQHPYTQRLLAAVPVPDPAEQRRRREARARVT